MDSRHVALLLSDSLHPVFDLLNLKEHAPALVRWGQKRRGFRGASRQAVGRLQLFELKAT